MHRDAGRWRDGGGNHPSVLSKGDQRGAEVPFHHRFRSMGIFGVAKDFCPNFPKLSRKVFCVTFTYKIFPTKMIKTFWCDLQKRSSCDFLQTLGAMF